MKLLCGGSSFSSLLRTKNKVMTEGTYKELIDFCSKLTIKQLMAYKNHVRPLKNKPYLI